MKSCRHGSYQTVCTNCQHLYCWTCEGSLTCPHCGSRKATTKAQNESDRKRHIFEQKKSINNSGFSGATSKKAGDLLVLIFGGFILFLPLMVCFLPAIIGKYVFRKTSLTFEDRWQKCLRLLTLSSLYLSSALTAYLMFEANSFTSSSTIIVYVARLILYLANVEAWYLEIGLFIVTTLPLGTLYHIRGKRILNNQNSTTDHLGSARPNQAEDNSKENEDPELNKWNSENPFLVLGITADASVAEIKESYRKLMNQYHPDRLPQEFRDFANEKTKIINWAYEECLKRKAA